MKIPSGQYIQSALAMLDRLPVSDWNALVKELQSEVPDASPDQVRGYILGVLTCQVIEEMGGSIK